MGSSPRCTIWTCLTESALIARIFGAASAAGWPSLAFSCRLDHHTAIPKLASRTPANTIRPHFIMSTPLPPYAQTGGQDQERNGQHARIECERHLVARHGQAAVVGLPGPNRN